jgi:hypothetical protein
LRRGRGLFLSAQVPGGSMGDKDGREETKQTYYDRQHPGTFFQYVGRLLYTHQLIAEAAYVAGETATLGILYQDDKA